MIIIAIVVFIFGRIVVAAEDDVRKYPGTTFGCLRNYGQCNSHLFG